MRRCTLPAPSAPRLPAEPPSQMERKLLPHDYSYPPPTPILATPLPHPSFPTSQETPCKAKWKTSCSGNSPRLPAEERLEQADQDLVSFPPPPHHLPPTLAPTGLPAPLKPPFTPQLDPRTVAAAEKAHASAYKYPSSLPRILTGKLCYVKKSGR